MNKGIVIPKEIKADPYRSDVERFFASIGGPVVSGLEEFRSFDLQRMTYEAVRLATPGGFYTLDFLVELKNRDGHILMVLIETKGGKKQRGYTDTRIKLRDVAALYPGFVFIQVIVKYTKRNGHHIDQIEFVTPPPFAHIVFPKELERK